MGGAVSINKYSWLSPTNGDWTASGTWSQAGFPNATDSAADIATAGNYTVTLSGADPAITLGALTLASSGATLSLQNALTIVAGGTVSLQDGTLALANGRVQGGAISLAGGTLAFDTNPGNTLSGVAVIGGLAVNG